MARVCVYPQVTVMKGPYTGYRGRVKQQTSTHVQLELDAIAGRAVTVPMNYVNLGGEAGGAPAGVPAGAAGYAGRQGGAGYGAPSRGGDSRCALPFAYRL